LVKKPFIKIDNIKIGENFEPLIIPEIGINHNGDLNTAFKMVDAAKRAGAKIIKHQTHIPDDEMSEEAKKIKPGNSKKNIYNIIEDCSLSFEKEYKLTQYCKKKKIIFISTPFSFKAVDRLVKFNVPIFKIGSGEIFNFPLLDYISKFKKKLIISSGMASIEQLKNTVSFLKKRNVDFAILHTTNLYPTPDNLIRLGSITQLRQKFKNNIIGLSDHSSSNYSCFGAVALGASIIEKHFTDTFKRSGPDISCSVDEIGLKELIKGCNIISKQRFGDKNLLKEEQVTRNFAYASVVSRQKIEINEILSLKNITVRRPGTGNFSAAEFKNLLGKKVRSIIKKNTQIKKRDLFK
tara:strand:- start:66 stop:1115 length:1050 start_codon:yes stop_codon:yes gene_type:complete